MRYTPELYAVTLIATATVLMWVPYVLARLKTRGLVAMANLDPHVPPDPLWAVKEQGAPMRMRSKISLSSRHLRWSGRQSG
jgi:hypothetical protein